MDQPGSGRVYGFGSILICCLLPSKLPLASCCRGKISAETWNILSHLTPTTLPRHRGSEGNALSHLTTTWGLRPSALENFFARSDPLGAVSSALPAGGGKGGEGAAALWRLLASSIRHGRLWRRTFRCRRCEVVFAHPPRSPFDVVAMAPFFFFPAPFSFPAMEIRWIFRGPSFRWLWFPLNDGSQHVSSRFPSDLGVVSSPLRLVSSRFTFPRGCFFPATAGGFLAWLFVPPLAAFFPPSWTFLHPLAAFRGLSWPFLLLTTPITTGLDRRRWRCTL